MKGKSKYIVTAPVGNIIAPPGAVTEEQLRAFGVSVYPQETWKEKFEKDPFDQVLGYFRDAGYTIKHL